MTSAVLLREPLERLYREFDYGARIARDAIEFPLRYAAADDREVVALLTACLAYGRVDLFSRQLEHVLRAMAPSPAAFVRAFDPRRHAGAFAAFIYRCCRVGTSTCSRCLRRAARASASTSSSAGWCGARRPTSACGRRSRPRGC
jgi:hypothetical protein